MIAHIHTSTRSPPDDVPAYPSAESTIASSESAERVDGASRPMKAASAHDVISGTSVRKTMTVSTLAAWTTILSQGGNADHSAVRTPHWHVHPCARLCAHTSRRQGSEP